MAIVTPVVTAYLVFVGLVGGSFINLAADRLPRGESIVSPPSHCRACGRRLDAVDLVPVLGYFLRRGRCATCRVPIGSTAPLVEAVAGACMLAPLLAFGLWPGALVGVGALAAWGVAVTTVAGRRFSASGQTG